MKIPWKKLKLPNTYPLLIGNTEFRNCARIQLNSKIHVSAMLPRCKLVSFTSYSNVTDSSKNLRWYLRKFHQTISSWSSLVLTRFFVQNINFIKLSVHSQPYHVTIDFFENFQTTSMVLWALENSNVFALLSKNIRNHFAESPYPGNYYFLWWTCRYGFRLKDHQKFISWLSFAYFSYKIGKTSRYHLHILVRFI